MKYTARGESRVANIAQGTRLSPRTVYFIQSGSVLSVLLYFTLTEVLQNTLIQ